MLCNCFWKISVAVVFWSCFPFLHFVLMVVGLGHVCVPTLQGGTQLPGVNALFSATLFGNGRSSYICFYVIVCIVLIMCFGHFRV